MFRALISLGWSCASWRAREGSITTRIPRPATPKVAWKSLYRIQEVLSQSQPVLASGLGFSFPRSEPNAKQSHLPLAALTHSLHMDVRWWWASTWKLCDAALLEPIINSLLIWFTLTWLERYLVKVGHCRRRLIWKLSSNRSSLSSFSKTDFLFVCLTTLITLLLANGIKHCFYLIINTILTYSWVVESTVMLILIECNANDN